MTNSVMDRWHIQKLANNAMDECQNERYIPNRMMIQRRERCENSVTMWNHPGVKEMSWMLKHGCASGLAIQEARQIPCVGRAVLLFALHFLARVLGLMNYGSLL